MRDISIGETIDVKFTSRQFSTGAPFALSGGAVAAYPANSTTQITAGITLTASFDSGEITTNGLNNVRVVATTGNGYANLTDYALVMTAGTVDGVTVIGEKVGEFTIGRSAAATRLGLLNVAAASGDPGTTTGVVAYLKQLVNVLVGTAGVATFPTEAAPANAVSLAEVIRAIHADVTGLNGATMRGTDNAALATELAKVPKSDGTVSWNATALAAILAEVNTAVDTAIPELGVAQPAVTPNLRTGLMLLYMALRNQSKVQTSGTDALEYYNDAGTLITSKLLTDDGADFTEAKMS